MLLRNKKAIVTGSSSGIGLAISMAILKKGAFVAGWSRSKSPIKDTNFTHIATDVSSFDSVKTSYAETIKRFGVPDILINNAGIGYASDFEKMDLEKWHQMFDVNVHGVFYCSKMVVPAMKEKGSGHIVNISSIAGRTGVKNMVGYASTKHAISGLSHSLFMELRSFGIKVSCIYPGSVNTHFFDNIEEINTHNHMMNAADIADTIIHVLESPANYHHVDIEVRPLKPYG